MTHNQREVAKKLLEAKDLIDLETDKHLEVKVLQLGLVEFSKYIRGGRFLSFKQSLHQAVFKQMYKVNLDNPK